MAEKRPPGAGRVLVVLLAAYLGGLAWLTLRPTRTLFEVREDRLVSSTEDWSLFMLHQGTAWDGQGTLRLRSRMRIVDQGAGIGLTVALAGGPGREKALLLTNQRPDREFRLRVHGTDTELTTRDRTPFLATAGVFHTCVAEASIVAGLLQVRAAVDGTEVGTWTCAATAFAPPLRFGLWGSRVGTREFADLRAEQSGSGGEPVVLADLQFDREEAAAGIIGRVAWSLAPFSLDHVPFFSSSVRRGRAFAEDLEDVTGNIALFLPAGYLLVRLLRGRVLPALLACVALSFAIECLQLLVPTRVSSVFDIVTNGLGGWIGAAAGAWLGRQRTGTGQSGG